MATEMGLQQMIYETLLTQIQFGTFHYMDSLSAAAEVSKHFHVSVDTMQAAYRRLKKEGYISLSRNVGAKVIVDYDDVETERHIQNYFALRKDALLDLCDAIHPLLGRIQRLGLRYASPETRANMEQLTEKGGRPPRVMWGYFEQKYAALGNAILIRLARQVFLFFQAPYFSVMDTARQRKGAERVRETLELCRRQDWTALESLLSSYQTELCASLHDFYRERITLPVSEQPVEFRWSSYKKPSQLCYSLVMDLLSAISRGVYPPGSLLPTMERLAGEKGVSLSTVRRAEGLLCSIGAVKSSRPYGMRVLPLLDSAKNCDFTQPALRKRLVDMLESLQILTLSCGAVAELTLNALDAGSINAWKRRISEIKDMPYYDVLPYVVLSLITNAVPSKTIRTVYTELLQQLFWGNPLRGMKGDRGTVNGVLEPYLSGLLDCLENGDTAGFSSWLEDYLLNELRDTADRMLRQGIHEAGAVLIPEKNEW